MEDRVKEITVNDMQKLELAMMKELHEFCEINKIRYALGFGSCLGAIRHNGFIPWDDDIDIIMPYPDYIKFISLKSNTSSRYQVYSIETDFECSMTFAKYIDTYTELNEEETISKTIGVYIDIFPIYGIPENKMTLKKYIIQLKIYDIFMSCARKKNYKGKTRLRSLIQCIIGPYAKMRGVEYYIRKILNLVREFSYDNFERVAYMPAAKWEKEIFLRKMLDSRELHQFEDTTFYVPGNTDEYLRIMYGDYMTLPPIEKRVTHHKYTVRFLHDE